MYLFGLDVGTSTVKSCVRTVDGDSVTSSRREYGLHHPKPGWSELAPDEVWGQIRAAIRDVVTRIDCREIRAISIAAIGHAIMPVDETGAWLYPLLPFYDTRGQQEAEHLHRLLGGETLRAVTGSSRVQQPLANMIWIQRNLPAVYGRTDKFIGLHEYLVWRLCGTPWIDYSLASCTSLFDLETGQWAPEILDAVEVDRDLLPDVACAGTVVGEVTAEGARATGLARGTCVVVGTHDAHSSALGTGIIDDGLWMEEAGTFEHICACSLQTRGRRLCGAINRTPPIPVVFSGFRTAGSILTWYKDTFAHGEIAEATATGQDVYDLLTAKAAQARPGADGLLLLPTFHGGAAGGAVIGLTLHHGQNEFLRALLEGITYEVRVHFDALRAQGVTPREIRAVGGGAKSPFWLQLKADVTQERITVPARQQVGTLGAAILAGIGVDAYRDAVDGVRRTYRGGAVYVPDEHVTGLYDRYYAVYQRLKATLENVSYSPN